MSDYFATSPTIEEFRAVIGTSRWAVCRNTEKNRERYGLCLTKKEYYAARKEALRRRGK